MSDTMSKRKVCVIMPLLKERVKEARRLSKLTLQDVADAIGVGQPAVHKYESGLISSVDVCRLEQLASVLGCDPAYLMGWQEEMRCTNTVVSLAENDHIEAMRTLTTEGQDKILEYTKDLIATGRYSRKQNSL